MPPKKIVARSNKSPLAKARDAWLESPEGKQALDSSILSNPGQTQYLENRLVAAFLAGAKWKDMQPRGTY